MAKKKKSKLATLVECWEKATPFMLEALVIRTAAYLAAVADVPRTVVESLDALGREDGKFVASHIGCVLGFLHELRRLEEMVSPPASAGGPDSRGDYSVVSSMISIRGA